MEGYIQLHRMKVFCGVLVTHLLSLMEAPQVQIQGGLTMLYQEL